MERLKLTLRLLSPLCASDRRTAGQFRESAGFVPGSVLRGAVAELMLRDGHRRRDGRTLSDEFHALFLGARAAVFGNAYPGEDVLPATAMSCKTQAGFRHDPGEHHGVKDTLIKRLCIESLRPAGLLYLPKCEFADCRMRLEQYPGFYRSDGDYISERVTQRLLTRVAINRRRATAEDQLLYSPIVISEGSWTKHPVRRRHTVSRRYNQTDLKSLLVVESRAEILIGYLRQIDHVGSGTARGLGLVETEVETISSTDELARLRERSERLNSEIKRRWDELKQWPAGCDNPPHSPDTGRYFTIDLYSDAILKERSLLPTNLLSATLLRERCGVEDDSLQLVRAYSGYSYRGGWNSAQGLPKDVDVVTTLGSVFVFWTTQPEKWEAPLLDLETWGIGERTAEGFGQVRVCDQFHLNYERMI